MCIWQWYQSPHPTLQESQLNVKLFLEMQKEATMPPHKQQFIPCCVHLKSTRQKATANIRCWGWSLQISGPTDTEHVLWQITRPKPCQRSPEQRCRRLYLFRVSGTVYRPFSTTQKTQHSPRICSCYFCTFILPYWQHMQGRKLMWSISKSGPKPCQIKDPTKSPCHSKKSFLLALSLFWSYPV